MRISVFRRRRKGDASPLINTLVCLVTLNMLAESDASNVKSSKTDMQSKTLEYESRRSEMISRNVTRILDTLLKDYDKRVRPNYAGPPVVVGVSININNINSVSEVNMDYTMDFFFRQTWIDRRLAFDGVNELVIGSDMLHKIWIPDTFIANDRKTYFHKATVQNKFIRIQPDGQVLYSMRMTVCAACPMDFRNFPMDYQECDLEIESYGFRMDDIQYKWAARSNKSALDIAPTIELPQLKYKDYKLIERQFQLSTGLYSRLTLKLYFVRSLGYFILQIYIPSTLIVVLSFMSFWLDRNAAPARVALGITTVLTMVTFIWSTNAALPKISYVKSIDVYLLCCFSMTFLSVIEYAIVSFIHHRDLKRLRRLAQAQDLLSNSLMHQQSALQFQQSLMSTASSNTLKELALANSSSKTGSYRKSNRQQQRMQQQQQFYKQSSEENWQHPPDVHVHGHKSNTMRLMRRGNAGGGDRGGEDNDGPIYEQHYDVQSPMYYQNSRSEPYGGGGAGAGVGGGGTGSGGDSGRSAPGDAILGGVGVGGGGGGGNLECTCCDVDGNSRQLPIMFEKRGGGGGYQTCEIHHPSEANRYPKSSVRGGGGMGGHHSHRKTMHGGGGGGGGLVRNYSELNTNNPHGWKNRYDSRHDFEPMGRRVFTNDNFQLGASLPHTDSFLARMQDSESPSQHQHRSKLYRLLRLKWKVRACTIDNISRVLFPSVFFSFHIIYWTYYLKIVHTLDD